jgi:hypothetical protein
MDLVIAPRICISRNPDATEQDKFKQWVCTLYVRNSIDMNDSAFDVFYGQSPLAVYGKALVALDSFLMSPEFIYPLLEEYANRG